MSLKSKLTEQLKRFPLTRACMEDYGFRTVFFAICACALNFIFAGFNCVAAVKYASVRYWYVTFTGYYIVLALQRISILLAFRKIKRKYADDDGLFQRAKWEIYLGSGVFFILLQFALAAVVAQMYLMEKPTETGEIMAITTAVYTVIKITLAIRNLAKAKAFEDVIVQTLRNIGFVDALASLLSLTTTLITTFGVMEGSMQTLFLVLGIVFCAFTITLGICMILRAAKFLKNKNAAEGGEKQQ